MADGGIVRIPDDGGDPERVTTRRDGEIGHYRPEFLPGGTAALFTIWSGSLGSAQIAVASLDSGEIRTLVNGTHPHYTSTGHVVFAREASLWAVPFDIDRLETSGTPTPVVEGVFVTALAGAAQFDVARNGTLVFVPEDTRSVNSRLAWVDRSGQRDILPAEPRHYSNPRLSPNGTRLMVVDRGTNDVWGWDFARETLTRLTFSPAGDQSPAWTPDGEHVAFSSSREGSFSIYWTEANGTGNVEKLSEATIEDLPLAFTNDGRQLVYMSRNPPNGWDLELLSLDGSSEPLVATNFGEQYAALSPDGRFLAYESNESGELAIYVRPFPDVEAGRWQVSTAEGRHVAWSPDGRELYYMTGAGLTAAAVTTEPAFSVGERKTLFDVPYAFLDVPSYDVAPDGRFLFVLPEEGLGSDRRQIHVVLDWFAELQRLVPTH